jgi:hypothetical protein
MAAFGLCTCVDRVSVPDRNWQRRSQKPAVHAVVDSVARARPTSNTERLKCATLFDGLNNPKPFDFDLSPMLGKLLRIKEEARGSTFRFVKPLFR